MKKLKSLLDRYITKKMSLEMEVEYLNDHHYGYEAEWKKFELQLLNTTIAHLRECLNGSVEEGK